ncbi:MAG: hypothetical protein HRT53_06185 [Colwellia sp.]|nr:hypothetical protein [Colwellia sp.]
MGNFYHGYQIKTLAQQKVRLDNLYDKHVEQNSRINTLEVELEVERMANNRSQILLKNMEKQHYQVKKELAFYEKIMAPEKTADGLVIDRVSVYPTGSPHHFRFQVVLVQQLLRKRFVKGYVAFTLDGSLDNKPSQLKLSTISTLTQKDLSFSFQYFQIIEGEFTLPENFLPEKIDLSTILTKNKWQKFQRLDETFMWSDLLTNTL